MKKRIISAIVMLLILVPLLLIGKLPFMILSLLLGLGSLYELLKLKKNIPNIVKVIAFILVGLLIGYSYFDINILTVYLNYDFRFLVIIMLIYLLMLVFINDQKKYNYMDAFYLIGITLFLGFAFGNIIRIRNSSLLVLIYLLIISILTDTFALLSGMMFGKHKLAPKISPNKTVEGLIGGTLIGTIGASLFYIFVIKDFSNIFLIILLTLFLSLMGSLGDLVKSSIKRNAGIKDFSNLIPGHGGILDRFDSLIFISLTYVIMINLF